jgi:putative intracellular protease/amidase
MSQLERSMAAADLNVRRYVAIYLPGGHGIMVDGPGNPHLRRALEEAVRADMVISAVCHGPAGFVGAEVDGRPIVAGKQVCA